MLAPIGEMREQAVVLTPVRTVDSSGGEVITYAESDPFFISLRSLTTNESVQFGQINSEVSHVAFGYWHDLNTITAINRIRIVETQQDFDIDGDPINDPKRAYTRLNLVMRSND
jgi:head-tail adaptor